MANWLFKSMVDGSYILNLRADYSRTIANDLTPAYREPRREVDEPLEHHLLTVCRIGDAPKKDTSELCISILSPSVFACSVR